MAKQYKGSLSLDWYNKQKAILLRSEADTKTVTDIPAPKINWVNKDEALFYEIIDEEGRGLKPYWVDRNDIRVKEARPLNIQKIFNAVATDKTGSLPGMNTEFRIEEISTNDNPNIENILIKGDNLLALNSLKKYFNNKPEAEKVKCAYLDMPYNTDSAFEHYDDSLEHSEWLTMTRDRLILIRDLLREDGCLFIHLDDKEAAYCKILLDEIFGRSNYCNQIIISTNKAFGFKSTSKDLFKQANHILFYAKNKELFELKKIFIEKDYDPAYSLVFNDITIPESEWTWQNIQDVVAVELGYEDAKTARKTIQKDDFENQIALFALKNSERVFQTAAPSGGAYLKRKDTIEKSKAQKDVILRHPNDDMDYLFIGGRRVIFYKERIVEIDKSKVPGEILTDIWDDISFEGLAHEGGVDFPKSKKPEKLVQRIVELGSNEGDLVMDIFGGSGTTFAVAHKMGRKWIGVEVGKHSDKLIVPRLKSVLLGTDQSGISKQVNWQGGGSFKYYHLGESIIRLNEDGTGDFNWSLGKEFIQESFLSSYDYIIDTSIDFQEGELFPDKKHQPLVGVQTIGTKKRVAVITLNEPNGKLETLSYEEMQSIYKTVKKKFSPEYINIFTNRGIEIAYDSKPDDLEVVKIPNAIFAELEK
jgi:adenine-specific DNA-methyltransferase